MWLTFLEHNVVQVVQSCRLLVSVAAATTAEITGIVTQSLRVRVREGTASISSTRRTVSTNCSTTRTRPCSGKCISHRCRCRFCSGAPHGLDKAAKSVLCVCVCVCVCVRVCVCMCEFAQPYTVAVRSLCVSTPRPQITCTFMCTATCAHAHTHTFAHKHTPGIDAFADGRDKGSQQRLTPDAAHNSGSMRPAHPWPR